MINDLNPMIKIDVEVRDIGGCSINNAVNYYC